MTIGPYFGHSWPAASIRQQHLFKIISFCFGPSNSSFSRAHRPTALYCSKSLRCLRSSSVTDHYVEATVGYSKYVLYCQQAIYALSLDERSLQSCGAALNHVEAIVLHHISCLVETADGLTSSKFLLHLQARFLHVFYSIPSVC